MKYAVIFLAAFAIAVAAIAGPAVFAAAGQNAASNISEAIFGGN